MRNVYFSLIVIITSFSQLNAQSLIAYYPFSGNGNDVSGNGYNGVLHGGASANDTLVIGNNDVDYFTIPEAVMNGLINFTVTFRFKANGIQNSGSYPGNDIITGASSNHNHELKIFYVEQYGSFIVTIHDLDEFFPFTMVAGQWYCVTVIRQSSNVIVYIDGVNIGTATAVPTSPMLFNAGALLAGQEQDCPGGCFVTNQSMDGKVDELKFYNYAFTDSQALAGCITSQGSNMFNASDTDLCEKFCISFFDSSTNNPTSWLWLFPGGDPASSTDQNPTNICYDVPGIYDVTLITANANGTDTITLDNYITVYATPPFPTITQTGNILTSSPAVSYQWQFNSYDISGATNQSYAISQSGYYTVIISDSNGCENSASLKVTLSGIEDVLGEEGISIYPNPSDDEITIQSLLISTNEPIAISIINILGEIVQQQNVRWKDQVTLDVKNLSPGIYLVKLENEEGKFTATLIKK